MAFTPCKEAKIVSITLAYGPSHFIEVEDSEMDAAVGKIEEASRVALGKDGDDV